MEPDLDGLHIIVTGGAGSLGTAVTRMLLDEGARCSVPCYSQEEMEEAPFESGERLFIRADIDLAEEKQAGHFYSRAVDEMGPLWGSVHIAGGFGMGKISDTPAGEFTRQWTMNTLTCYNCCRAAVRHIRQAGKGGRLVNVASRPALEPRQGAGMSAYTAAKAGVAALTGALGEELAEEEILVNAVAPSIIDTEANRQAMPDADHGRWPKPEEIASQIRYLVSPHNRVTRGGVVPVYGQS